MTSADGRFERSRGFALGAGLGALVLTAAGAAWSLVALIFRPGSSVWQFVLAVVPALVLATFIVRRIGAIARMPEPPATPSERLEGARQGRRMGLLFGTVFAIEMALIAATAVLLARANRPLLIPVAVVAIIGAHFLPLAKLFRIPTYFVTGAALVGLTGLSFLISDESTRAFLLGLSVTAVLWASAAAVLVIHLEHVSSANVS